MGGVGAKVADFVDKDAGFVKAVDDFFNKFGNFANEFDEFVKEVGDFFNKVGNCAS